MLGRHGARESEGSIAGVVARVRRNGLVVVLLRRWGGRLLQLRRPRDGFCGSRRRGSRQVVGAKAGEAHGAGLHVVSSNTSALGDDEGLGGPLQRRTHLRGLRRPVFGSAHCHLCAQQVLDDGHGWVRAGPS